MRSRACARSARSRGSVTALCKARSTRCSSGACSRSSCAAVDRASIACACPANRAVWSACAGSSPPPQNLRPLPSLRPIRDLLLFLLLLRSSRKRKQQHARPRARARSSLLLLLRLRLLEERGGRRYAPRRSTLRRAVAPQVAASVLALCALPAYREAPELAEHAVAALLKALGRGNVPNPGGYVASVLRGELDARRVEASLGPPPPGQGGPARPPPRMARDPLRDERHALAERLRILSATHPRRAVFEAQLEELDRRIAARAGSSALESEIFRARVGLGESEEGSA